MKYILILLVFLSGCHSDDLTSISVSTLNVAKSNDMDAISKFYESNKVYGDFSVVGFQEVLKTPNELGFGPLIDKGPSVHSEVAGYGFYIYTYASGASDHRMHQAAMLANICGKDILFISVHFMAYHRDVAYEQVKALVVEIQSLEYDEIVIMGDFNITKGTKWFDLIQIEMESVGLSAVDVDGVTFEDRVIDYVFLSDGLNVDYGKVSETNNLTDHNMVSVRVFII